MSMLLLLRRRRVAATTCLDRDLVCRDDCSARCYVRAWMERRMGRRMAVGLRVMEQEQAWVWVESGKSSLGR